MNKDLLSREDDIERLRVAALELLARATDSETRTLALEAENGVLLGRITKLVSELAVAKDSDQRTAIALEIKRVNELLAQRNKELFGGSKSERRLAPPPEPDPAEKAKQKGHGPTRQTKIPPTTVPHVRANPDTPCPSCKDPQPAMAGQTEDTEQITIIERRLVLCVHAKQKYRCLTCGRIDVATGAPAPLMPGGRYAPEVAVAVAVDKYADHLPLERQVDRFERQGFTVTSQTLWDQIAELYRLLLPAYLAIHSHLLDKPVLGADESSWRVMGKGKSAKWWTWALVAEDAVFYRLAPSRGKAAAMELLRGFKGIVSVDGYPVYTSLEASGIQASLFVGEGCAELCKFILVCCWTHARREFIKAENNHPTAKEALDLIAKLYRVETKANDIAKQTGEPLLDVRRRLRDTESRAIIAELDVWRKAQRPVPSLQLAKALTYLDNQWPRLIRYLDEPRAPIDNGWAERAIRGTVLGRKNHYGSRSELGTRVAALFYTMMETCKLLEVEPAAYLLEAALRARANPENVLTPMAWKAELAAKPVPA